MPFDPTLPVTNAPIVSAELRNQFTALKALIDALAEQIAPIGGVVAWCKDLSGVPALGASFAECNGQVLSDAQSPLDGVTLPDLNGGQRFLRGASASGGTGGSDSHTHTLQALDADHGNFNSVSNSTNDVNALAPGVYSTEAAVALPPHYEVVWVMRVR